MADLPDSRQALGLRTRKQDSTPRIHPVIAGSPNQDKHVMRTMGPCRSDLSFPSSAPFPSLHFTRSSRAIHPLIGPKCFYIVSLGENGQNQTTRCLHTQNQTHSLQALFPFLHPNPVTSMLHRYWPDTHTHTRLCKSTQGTNDAALVACHQTPMPPSQ